MWDIGLNVSCILVKRSEVEVKFLRAARRHVLSVIRRHTSNHVGGHRVIEAHSFPTRRSSDLFYVKFI